MTLRSRVALSILVAAWLGCAGCGLMNAVTGAPSKLASSLTPTQPLPKIPASALAEHLMRFADLFALEITKGSAEFAASAGTPEAHIQALRWRIDYSSTIWKRATVDQPYVGLFDTIVLVTALRAAHEERWSAVWGEPNRPMITALKRLEEAVWKLAGDAMTPDQVAQSHTVIDTWMAGDPAERSVDIARLPGFDQLASSDKSSSFVGGLTDLVRIDPLAGLEPATREVQQTRALAERFFYYVQRLPEVLAARVELLTLQGSQASETRTVLEGLDRASRSAESIAATAQALPAQFSAERSAAIEQISAELERQRAGLVGDIENARAPLSELLGETRTTAEATRALSDSLTATLQTLGIFLDRFKKKEGVEPDPRPEPTTPARPFDITEYGATADRIGAAVHELNTTIATLDRNMPEVQRVLEEATAHGERTIDYAYRRMLELLGLTLVGTAAAVLLVRWISRGRRVRAQA
jgi:hypothetical protein